MLDDSYVIVLVGTDDIIRGQLSLSSNIIGIDRTNDQIELAEIYSAADIFVNPTREDNYPTVNMEAIACGTPVITFNTGGSSEMVDDTCGAVVDVDDVEGLVKEIKRFGKKTEQIKNNCVKKGKNFDATDRYMEYIELYTDISTTHYYEDID